MIAALVAVNLLNGLVLGLRLRVTDCLGLWVIGWVVAWPALLAWCAR